MDWSDGEGGAHVVRAPLFAHVDAKEGAVDGLEGGDDRDALPAFVNTEPVLVPPAALSRRVHFFPHHNGGSSAAKEPKQRVGDKTKGKHGGKGNSGGKHPYKGKQGTEAGEQDDDPVVATVLISSEDAKNGPGGADTSKPAGGYRGRAQVVQLKRTQLGGWTRLRYSEMERGRQSINIAPTRMEAWSFQLLSKYEEFDKTKRRIARLFSCVRTKVAKGTEKAIHLCLLLLTKIRLKANALKGVVMAARWAAIFFYRVTLFLPPTYAPNCLAYSAVYD